MVYNAASTLKLRTDLVNFLTGGSQSGNGSDSKFPSLLRQSFVALSSGLAGIFAGFILSIYANFFSVVPWALTIYPGMLSIRGAIGGLFSGRLSTGLHVGTIKPSFTENTKDFYLLWSAVATLTLISSLIMSILSTILSLTIEAATIGNVITMLGVLISTMFLSLIIKTPVTMAISFTSFKYGLDPDVITYPVSAVITDIIVTVCYGITLSLSFFYSVLGASVIWILNVVFFAITFCFVFRNLRETEFIKTVREAFFTIVAVAFIVNITGLFLVEIAEFVKGRKEIYVIYPALIDIMGGVGSIVGSTATTKLTIGTLEHSIRSIREHLAEIFGAWIASLIMYVFSVFFLLIWVRCSVWRFLTLIYTVLLSNVLSAPIICLIAFTVGMSTFRRGLDPDNFVIPIESSLADAITTICLLISLIIVSY